MTEFASAATTSNNSDQDKSTMSTYTLDQPIIDTPISVGKKEQKEKWVNPVSKVG